MRYGLLAGAVVLSAAASSFYEQPFPDTVRGAPNIVRGRIGKSEAQWTTLSDGSKHLFTYYDVEVGESLKGQSRAGAIRIRELGGDKDGVSLQVSGSAKFTAGEDVVVMLGEPGKSGDGAYPLTGMMMGKYNVEKGADGKEYLRGPGLGGSLHPEMRREGSPTEGQTQISLDGLREIIRTQAAEPAPSPTVEPAKASDGLLSSRANPPGMPAPGRGEELLPKDQNAEEPPAKRTPYLFLAGAVVGVGWFLFSRRKRR